jgi:outer membrane protein TolC
MISSEAALESALEQFRILLGLSPSDPVQPGGLDSLEQTTEEIEPLQILVQRALDQRLELREASDQVSDARRSHAVAGQALLPQLDVTLSFSRFGLGPGLSQALRDSDERFDVFVTASYPLERSAARVNREVAGLAMQARQRDLRQRQLQVESEVRAAVRNLERIGKSVELQSKGVEFARQQYRLATLRYQRGLASNFDVIEAEGSLVSARTALAGLVTDYRVARVQLKRATGSLDVEEMSP